MDEELGIKKTLVPRPPLRFDTGYHRLNEIAARCKLPIVVQCDDAPVPYQPALNSHLGSLLLAYTTRSVEKIRAKNVRYEPASRTFTHLSGDLLIPEDFEGWFAILGKPGLLATHQVQPHFTEIREIANDACIRFLVAGNKPITVAICINNNNNSGDEEWTDHKLLPGTVLQKTRVIKEEPKGKKKKRKSAEVCKFLKCVDQNERDVKIDMRVKGEFYVVSQEGTPDIPPVMQIKEILNRNALPLYVEMVYGKSPHLPSTYTRSLLLTSAQHFNTMVFSTMICYNNILLEILLDSPLSFKIAKNTKELRTSEAYTSALKLCESIVSYVKWIKVIIGKESNPRDSSDTPNDTSDMDETQAKTFFTSEPESSRNSQQITRKISVVKPVIKPQAVLQEEEPLSSQNMGRQQQRLELAQTRPQCKVQDQMNCTPYKKEFQDKQMPAACSYQNNINNQRGISVNEIPTVGTRSTGYINIDISKSGHIRPTNLPVNISKSTSASIKMNVPCITMRNQNVGQKPHGNHIPSLDDNEIFEEPDSLITSLGSFSEKHKSGSSVFTEYSGDYMLPDSALTTDQLMGLSLVNNETLLSETSERKMSPPLKRSCENVLEMPRSSFFKPVNTLQQSHPNAEIAVPVGQVHTLSNHMGAMAIGSYTLSSADLIPSASGSGVTYLVMPVNFQNHTPQQSLLFQTIDMSPQGSESKDTPVQPPPRPPPRQPRPQ